MGLIYCQVMVRNRDNETDGKCESDSSVRSHINMLPSLRRFNKYCFSIRHGRVSDTIIPPSLSHQEQTHTIKLPRCNQETSPRAGGWWRLTQLKWKLGCQYPVEKTRLTLWNLQYLNYQHDQHLVEKVVCTQSFTCLLSSGWYFILFSKRTSSTILNTSTFSLWCTCLCFTMKSLIIL